MGAMEKLYVKVFIFEESVLLFANKIFDNKVKINIKFKIDFNTLINKK